MTNRRVFVQSCMAVSAAAALGPVLRPAAVHATEPRALTLERFIYDPRFAEAFDVAQHVATSGVPLSPVADDLMRLWYDELDLAWRREPLPLAGVTMVEALFVLETLAADHRMRVVFRGEHGAADRGGVSHSLAGPAAVLARFAPAPEEARWEAALADAMTSCPLGTHRIAERRLMTRARELGTRDVPLVSWIIAPRALAAPANES